MAKTNIWKLIKKYENTTAPTSFWYNKETKNFEIWRNHGCVKVLSYKGYVLYEDMEVVAKIDADEWVAETENKGMSLNEYLERNNLQLTELELRCLHLIFGEGSFYEENGELDFQDMRKYGAFIGWDINEEEIPGCRGALSSLKKKGILTIVDEDGFADGVQQAYYIHFSPEFKKEGKHFYHELDIHPQNLK